MNAAFLLVTTAWLAGADAAPAAPVMHHAAPTAGCSGAPAASCGSCCDTCDSCCKPSLLDRLRARFRKCDDCCDSCAPAPTCCAPAPTCGKSSCDSCDSCCKPSLLDRLRARFRKCDDCCDTCSSCGAAPIHHHPGTAPKAEPIPPPKDGKPMPSGDKPGVEKPPNGKEVQAIPQAPALDVAPRSVPTNSPAPF